MAKASYAASGVDVEAGERAVELMRSSVARTNRPEVLAGLGGFAGLFDLSNYRHMVKPLLATSTDGVGTKIAVARAMDKHDTVGIDLVAMVVDDLVVCGAEPLFLTDYIATGSVDPARMAAIVSGISEGCVQAGCALIGGETAEMPGLYRDDDFDLAGCIIGHVTDDELLGPEHVTPGMELWGWPSSGLHTNGYSLARRALLEGDVLLGLASDGVHSNGFSLVRRVAEAEGLTWDAAAPFGDGTLGAALLTPTRLYVRPALAALRAGGLRGLAHITGGGLTENLPRVLPEGLGARVDLSAWSLPPVFGWLREAGGIAEAEMLRSFNCGIGMVAVAAPDRAEALAATLEAEGERVAVIGRVEAGEGVVHDGRLG